MDFTSSLNTMNEYIYSAFSPPSPPRSFSPAEGIHASPPSLTYNNSAISPQVEPQPYHPPNMHDSPPMVQDPTRQQESHPGAEPLHREAEREKRKLAERKHREQARAVLHKRQQLMQKTVHDDVEWLGVGNEQRGYIRPKGKQPLSGVLRQFQPPFPNHEIHERYSPQPSYPTYPSRSTPPIVHNPANSRRLPPLTTSPTPPIERWQQYYPTYPSRSTPLIVHNPENSPRLPPLTTSPTPPIEQSYPTYPSRSTQPIVHNPANSRRLPPLTTSPTPPIERWQQYYPTYPSRSTPLIVHNPANSRRLPPLTMSPTPPIEQSYPAYPSRSTPPIVHNPANSRRLPPLTTSPTPPIERWQQSSCGQPAIAFTGNSIRSPTASYPPAYVTYSTNPTNAYSYHIPHDHASSMGHQVHTAMYEEVPRIDPRSSSAYSHNSGTSHVSPPRPYTPQPISPTSPEEPTIKKKRKRADAA